ncbi:12554_t:CDS:2, partial [Gigaspora rosea]
KVDLNNELITDLDEVKEKSMCKVFNSVLFEMFNLALDWIQLSPK